MLTLHPLGCDAVVYYQSYYGGVFSRFDDGIGGMDGVAVVGEEGVEEAAQPVPVFRMRVDDVRPPILMFCGSAGPDVGPAEWR